MTFFGAEVVVVVFVGLSGLYGSCVNECRRLGGGTLPTISSFWMAKQSTEELKMQHM